MDSLHIKHKRSGRGYKPRPAPTQIKRKRSGRGYKPRPASTQTPSSIYKLRPAPKEN